MSISADSLIDRLYLKAQINKWRTLAVLFAVIALLITAKNAAPGKTTNNDFIARITIDGIVGDNQKLYDLISDVEDNKKR